MWKICSTNGWWSVFGKKKARKTAKVSTPAHDDLVRRQFGAEVPNQLWLGRLTPVEFEAIMTPPAVQAA